MQAALQQGSLYFKVIVFMTLFISEKSDLVQMYSIFS